MPNEEPDMSKATLVSPNTVVHFGVIPIITMGNADIKDLSIVEFFKDTCLLKKQVVYVFINFIRNSVFA